MQGTASRDGAPMRLLRRLNLFGLDFLDPIDGQPRVRADFRCETVLHPSVPRASGGAKRSLSRTSTRFRTSSALTPSGARELAARVTSWDSFRSASATSPDSPSVTILPRGIR